MKLDREFLEWLIFGGEGGRRYTQSSPVLPDVWTEYGTDPGRRHQLLLTPHRDASAGTVARVLRRRLGLAGPGGPEDPEELGHFLVYTPTSVAVRVSLRELIRDVLPMTSWWEERFFGEGDERHDVLHEDELLSAFESLEEDLTRSRRRSEPTPATGRGSDPRKAEEDGGTGKVARRPPLSVDVVWMSWIVGWLAWAEQADPGCRPPEAVPPRDPGELREWLDGWRSREDEAKRGPTPEDLIHALGALFGLDESAEALRLPDPPREEDSRIWQINRNREAYLAVRDSRLAIKADAAWSLFDVSCRKLAWAVIDSGIDARHPAFRELDRDGKPYQDPFPGGKNRTRVEATFDFTRTRLLLNPALLARLEEPITKKEEASDFTELPAKLEKALEGLETDDSHRESLRGQLADLRAMLARNDAAWHGDGPSPLRVQLEDLKKRLQRGARVDWGLLEPFLEVPHDDDGYWAPASDHGTHVAGILGADWRDEHDPKAVVLQGICPDIRLYDLRVLPTGRPGPEDELNVIAALQFVRHLNSASTDIVIHGANLSLSIPHAVASFACGCTPVCEECERVVAGGVVVVAAAGNNGWQRYSTSKGLLDGYHTISITDPGNTEAVITVGATHRNKPHTYGVSYFSSRGPTGDGRIKPDLVAPGEKISAPVPGGFEGEKDGTSMAAPHVSGAAAILMARHRELIGQAGRVKKILCDTATDLGRERYFQGHGMLDVLRAVQSV
jgi:serine protease AprX